MNALIAQAVGGFGIVHYAILLVVVIAVVALVALFLRYSGITLPPILLNAIYIVVGAVVVVAIIIVARFAGFA